MHTTFKNVCHGTVAALTGLVLSSAVALAASLDAPTGDVVLTVSGDIGSTNAGDTAAFDRAMLQDMPTTEFTTTTIWTEGEQTFTGVELADFLDAVGAEGTTIEAKAINDYSVEVPVSDAVKGGPILAYKMNGDDMSRRDKGPIWLVYPYDQEADYRSETVYSRSIWQLDRLSVR